MRDADHDDEPTLGELQQMLAPPAPEADARARDSLLEIVSARDALVPVAAPPERGVDRGRVAKGGAIALAVLGLSMIALAAVRREAPPSVPADAARAEVPAAIDPRPVAAEIVVEDVAFEVAPTEVAAADERTHELVERAPAVRVRPHVAAVPRAARTAPAVAPTAPAPRAPAAAIDPALAALLDGALAGPRAPTEREALPLVPAQRDVHAALRALERRVATCREGEGGVATAHLVIDGATGRVARLDVRGTGADVACVAAIVETATFPRFARSDFSVAYPYRL